MKSALRTFVFCLISVQTAVGITHGLVFDTKNYNGFYLFVLSITLLYFFLKPILTLISMPKEGVGYIFIQAILTLVLIHALLIFVPFVSVVSSKLSDLIILGFMLPSKSLDPFWSSVYTAFSIALVYTFFDWLCPKHK